MESLWPLIVAIWGTLEGSWGSRLVIRFRLPLNPETLEGSRRNAAKLNYWVRAGVLV